ncbi:serine/threonine protein kinase [Streptomyces sp. A0958]|uniref:outer membrane protein assembly factor BamB family protein n=1 Tax=Streptomyces sp. A0958 TaxID=2563101 RepID=UPI00109EBA6E|nr:PQQ-binding-like beta-propeller repeat protein [Streptomyces sp. A0958]THA70360.1 serine/threonine protein kinase [Streptomyces sp. A0958]
MEALRQDDPGRFGPYTVLGRLRETAASVQYLARGTAAQDLVVVTAARPALAALPAFRHRFDAEARIAGRLAGGWVAEVLDTPADGSGEDDRPWTASAYVPALPLAEAIETVGPLPERAVRILGAAIAETLSRVHATGAVLQGLSPRTVLLAEDGPRLAAFGPLGAAAEAEAGPGGGLSVRLGYLTPEQLAGEAAGPASDLFVLGLLLAYAATGSTPLADGPPAGAAERIARADPELGGVPDALRDLVARCLAKDPADRPGAGEVAAELALEGAAGLAAGGWLPDRLSAAVAAQGATARRLAAEPEPDEPVPAPATEPVNESVSDEKASVENPVSDHDPVSDENPSGAQGADAPKSYGDVWDAVAAAPPGAGIQDAVPHNPAPPAPAWQQPPVAGAVPGNPVPAPDTRTTQLRTIGQQASAPWPNTGTYEQQPYAQPAQPPQPLPAPLPPAPAPNAAPPAGPRPAGPNRRALLFGGAAGVAGLLIGGGAVYALGSGDDAKAADDPKPAPSSGGPTLAGAAPQPRWIYTHPEAEPAPLTAALWNDRLLVLTDEQHASAVDLRTGRRVWENADGAKGRAALPVDEEHCFVAGPAEFLWISAKDGEVAHRLAYTDGFQGAPGLELSTLVGAEGASIWFTAAHEVTVKAPKPKKGKKRGKDKQVVKSYLFAYDVVQRKELWRTPVPNGRGDVAPAYRMIAVRPDSVVVRQRPTTLTPAQVKAAKKKSRFSSYDRKTGKLQWTKAFGTVGPDAAATGDEDGALYAADGTGLRAFETPGGKAKWTLKGGRDSAYGPSVLADDLLTTNVNQEVGAVDRTSGEPRWRRSTEATPDRTAPLITVSGSGDTVLAAGTGQVTAFAAADGRRLWKFQDIGNQDPKGATVTDGYQVLAYGKTAVVRRGRTVYAFPVV